MARLQELTALYWYAGNFVQCNSQKDKIYRVGSPDEKWHTNPAQLGSKEDLIKRARLFDDTSMDNI